MSAIAADCVKTHSPATISPHSRGWLYRSGCSLAAAIIGKETDKLLEAVADALLNKPLNIPAMEDTIAGLDIKDSVA